MRRGTPGPCIVCGAAHCGCTAQSSTAQIIRQLPARDGLTARALPPVPTTLPLVAEIVQPTLPPGTFTTATYRRKRSR